LLTVDQAIRERRATRKFAARAVDAAILEEVLDLARRAPSSMNGQPWRFVVVRGAAAKDTLASIKNRYCPPEKRDYPADFLRQAPVIVVVCVETERAWGREIESGVLAAGTLMLAAAGRGLGSVYLTAYQSGEPRVAAEIRRVIGLDAPVQPIALVPLGYPAEPPPAKSLRPLAEMVVDDGR
jgi:nitroreductase